MALNQFKDGLAQTKARQSTHRNKALVPLVLRVRLMAVPRMVAEMNCGTAQLLVAARSRLLLTSLNVDQFGI
jgi:hypothetical protein